VYSGLWYDVSLGGYERLSFPGKVLDVDLEKDLGTEEIES
jgi:hypothetical protein